MLKIKYIDADLGMRAREMWRPAEPDGAVAAGGMWAIFIPLVSSVKRQELSKKLSPCVCAPSVRSE